ncbi:S-adenosylmethionine-dependent methyltransferase, putative [Trichophyton benhamiae CBS 112371]|uniref:Protein-lysine N-methyltransferase EFM4 n=1 Tax=Arthroderma benhamiae (strain ATCC MYA-4681 / CBS 112371) TaxID=663331 RepID=D4AMX5_ARTBC|nr:S-adenosylmethionine-dependent methyltransferase, putative [Trichophyton benhamiae CBS 112371]EFE35536.1 S-adenosylmethionine-dependent methyltransferase, putative [Trichophyton benhamiae CBS 112371]
MPLEEEQGGSHPQHLEPSELGTKEYHDRGADCGICSWERYYDSSLAHFLSSKRDGRRRRDEQQIDGGDDDDGQGEDDDSDIGTSWFSEHNAPQKVLDFVTSEKFPLAPDYSQAGRESSILDLGTGNGSMLTLLREEGGFSGPMVGVDYSVKSIELARQLAGQGDDGQGQGQGQSQGKGYEGIRFEVWDILDPRHEADIRSGVFGKEVDWFPFEQGGFDIVLDKGTFDAVSLSAEGGSRRICEKYPGVALGLVRKGGFLIITSCNWTESELVSWFTAKDHGDGDGDGHGFTVYDQVEYPKFRFGGREGQGVCTICFQRNR